MHDECGKHVMRVEVGEHDDHSEVCDDEHKLRIGEFYA